jgi:hypothetical protein
VHANSEHRTRWCRLADALHRTRVSKLGEKAPNKAGWKHTVPGWCSYALGKFLHMAKPAKARIENHVNATVVCFQAVHLFAENSSPQVTTKYFQGIEL